MPFHTSVIAIDESRRPKDNGFILFQICALRRVSLRNIHPTAIKPFSNAYFASRFVTAATLGEFHDPVTIREHQR
jgi:hypothetical protein